MLKNHTKNHKLFTKFTLAVLAIAISIFSISTLGNIQSASAANPLCSQPGVSEEVLRANGCKNDAPDLGNTIVNIISGVVATLGLVAVIFIVVGGVNYMTSAGDSGKLKKAKDTILYATIGLVICVLAFAIVNFVIANIINNESSEEEESRVLVITS